ncbi:M56 family metallopeptidase [Streptomyces iakyrus]|uniref:M56 family metallopeptidase n=1 Tax=Streptomyces iakyrus TaxID=68219 RepID=UPI0033ADC174
MAVTGALLVYAALLGGPAGRMLTRSEWAVRAPRPALLAWHTCAAGFLLSVAGVLVLTAHDLWKHVLIKLFHATEAEIHAVYTGPWHVQLIADAALLLLLGGPTALAVHTARRARRARHERSRHRLATDALTEPGHDDLGSVRILDHPAPAAFCIPGPRKAGRIVVTRGALGLLTEEEVAATVAHEQAHLRFRHSRAILLADALTSAVGWTGALRDYARQVRRLTEMAADDYAAERHGRRTVASALLTMCTADNSGTQNGTALLSLTGQDPAERIRRLIKAVPPTAGRVPRLLAVCAATTVLALPPVLSLAPAAALAGTVHCVTDCRDQSPGTPLPVPR